MCAGEKCFCCLRSIRSTYVGMGAFLRVPSFALACGLFLTFPFYRNHLLPPVFPSCFPVCSCAGSNFYYFPLQPAPSTRNEVLLCSPSTYSERETNQGLLARSNVITSTGTFRFSYHSLPSFSNDARVAGESHRKGPWRVFGPLHRCT